MVNIVCPQFANQAFTNSMPINQYTAILNKITPTFSFTTPGTLNTMIQLQTIANNINANVQPWANAFANMKLTSVCAPTYHPNAWATVNDAVGTSETNWVNDASAAYGQTLMYVFTGNTVFANNASNCIGQWANTLTDFGGLGWSLDAAWGGAVWAQACDLLRSACTTWTGANAAFAMFNNVVVPCLHNNLMYGNRQFAAENCLMSAAVFMKDPALLYEAVQHCISYIPQYFYLSTDNNGTQPYTMNYWNANSVPPYLGNTYLLTLNANVQANVWGSPGLPNWITHAHANIGNDATGLINESVNLLFYNANTYINGMMGETGRDLGHCESSIAECVNAVECAYNQGLDIYSIHGVRLATAMEVLAAQRLGLPDMQAANRQAYPLLDSGNGISSTYEILYNHMVNIKGYPMPNTANLITNVIRHLPANGFYAAPFPAVFPSGLFANNLFAVWGFAVNFETMTHAHLNGSSP